MNKAWQVGIIVDPLCDPKTISTLSEYMPVWVIDTLNNAPSIAAAWSEKRDCTSFKAFSGEDRSANLLSNFDTIELHHPSMTCVHIVGLEESPSLTAHFARMGFVPAQDGWPHALAFRRLQVDWTGVPNLLLNAAQWKTIDDVYDALFAALKSPSWHGRNFDALYDSIVAGQINGVELPYRIIVRGIDTAAPDATAFTQQLVQLITECEDRGCPVSIRMDGSDTSELPSLSK